MYNFHIAGSGLLPAPDPDKGPLPGNDSNLGVIAGVIAAVVVLLVIITIVVLVMRHRSSGPEQSYLTPVDPYPMVMTVENEAFSRSPEDEYAYLNENNVSNGLDKSDLCAFQSDNNHHITFLTILTWQTNYKKEIICQERHFLCKEVNSGHPLSSSKKLLSWYQ